MVSDKQSIKAHSVNSEDFKYILGRYETEERAREVLQEIINTYKKQIEIVYTGSYDYRPVNSIVRNIYEMPAE